MIEVADQPALAAVPTAPVARRKSPERPKMTRASIEAAKAEAARYDLKDHQVTGLRLTVFPSGVKTWSLRYTVAVVGGFADRRLTIGNYPTIGLDDARKVADAAKRDVMD